MTTYRILFETVDTMRIREFTDRDPALYHSRDVHQIVPNSEIPDDAWHQVITNPTEDPWDQHATLVIWATEDREFVRKVRLEQMVSEPVWEEVP
jgi:hypothetical protein